MALLAATDALPLGAAALDELAQGPFGVYVHVPWCASRCGYCDFNTYVPGRVRGAAPAAFAATAAAELELAARALAGAAPAAQSVFSAAARRRCSTPPHWPACCARWPVPSASRPEPR